MTTLTIETIAAHAARVSTTFDGDEYSKIVNTGNETWRERDWTLIPPIEL